MAISQPSLEFDVPRVLSDAEETFEYADRTLVRRLRIGDTEIESRIEASSKAADDPRGTWWQAYLKGQEPVSADNRGTVRTVDLFCGPGGLALGFRQFCTEAGVSVVSEGIVDEDVEATRVYASNHRTRRVSNSSVTSIVDYRVKGAADDAKLSYEPEIIDEGMAQAAEQSQVVLAGPPCQGHSNLNNHSRRVDRRNELYLTVPAYAIAGNIPIAIIENVPAVLNDAARVVDSARRIFSDAGYSVTTGVVSASEMGWPQTRKRHFMIARKDLEPIPLPAVEALLRDEPRSFWWAVKDLENLTGDDALHEVADLSEENQARVAWLFDNDEHDLASSERPKSHQNGTTYTAVYGRLHADRPAPTITGGFMSPGRGRYVHPTQRRVISAREAARIQGFPDTYDWSPDPSAPPTKVKLGKWIGDAVPMPLGYAAALSALGRGIPE